MKTREELEAEGAMPPEEKARLDAEDLRGSEADEKAKARLAALEAKADPTNSEQVEAVAEIGAALEAVDHRFEAKRWTAAADREAADSAHDSARTFALVAQNYATLALVDEVAKLQAGAVQKKRYRDSARADLQVAAAAPALRSQHFREQAERLQPLIDRLRNECEGEHVQMLAGELEGALLGDDAAPPESTRQRHFREFSEGLLSEEKINVLTEILDEEFAAQTDGEAVTDYALAKRILKTLATFPDAPEEQDRCLICDRRREDCTDSQICGHSFGEEGDNAQ